MGKALTPMGIDEQYSVTPDMKSISTIISLTDVVARQDTGLELFDESRFITKILVEVCYMAISAKINIKDIKELFRETLTHTDVDTVIARQAKHTVKDSFIEAVVARINAKLKLFSGYTYCNYGGFNKSSEDDSNKCTSYELDVFVFNCV